MGKKSRSKRQKNQVNIQVTPGTSREAVAQVMPTSTTLGERLATTSRVVTQGDYGYVREDIRRILFLLVIIVALLTTALVLNYRTPLLRQAGSNIATFLQLQ